MRVMVTGSTGFVGFHTVLALLEAGHEVCLGVRNPEKMKLVFGPLGIDGLDYVEGSITDEAAVNRALEDCEGVVHAAAMVNLDSRQADFVRRTNLRGTELVVGGAVERGVGSIVHVSSTTALFTPGLERLTEDSPLGRSSNGYGQSKVESEKFVRRLQEEGAPIATTYPPGILGPDDPGLSEGNQGLTHFFNYMFYETSSGYQVVDVRDLARVHVELLERRSGGRYVVGGHYRPWKEFADLLDEVTGLPLTRVNSPGWIMRLSGDLGDLIKRVVPFDIPVTREAVTYATEWVYADSSRLREDLGFEFRDLRETLVDTILWLQRAGHIERKWVEKILAEQVSQWGNRL